MKKLIELTPERVMENLSDMMSLDSNLEVVRLDSQIHIKSEYQLVIGCS